MSRSSILSVCFITNIYIILSVWSGAATSLRQLGANIDVGGHIECGVSSEEVRWCQVHLNHFHGPKHVSFGTALVQDSDLHHGPVFHARVVGQTKDAPEHDILVLDIVLSGSRIANTAHLVSALQGVAATCV